MKVAVKDANVFIDLESMGILDLWFQLDYPTMTSSFVVMELAAGGMRMRWPVFVPGRLPRWSSMGRRWWARLRNFAAGTRPRV